MDFQLGIGSNCGAGGLEEVPTQSSLIERLPSSVTGRGEGCCDEEAGAEAADEGNR